MKSKFYFLLLVAFLFSLTINAQVNLTATAGTASASYATLTLAFNAINSGTHGGVINITITASTSSESPTLTVNSYTSIKIVPSGAIVMSGQNSNGAVVELNGASNVTIDGLNTGGNSLTIQNNQTTSQQLGTCCYEIFNGGSNNKLRNCTLLANVFSFSGITNGVVMLQNTVASQTITGFRMDNCTIGPAANAATSGNGVANNEDIFISNAGTGSVIANDTISNCTIKDFSRNGLYIAGSVAVTGIVITGNSFFRSSAYTFTTTGLNSCIQISNSNSSGNKIVNNYFGGTSANGGTASTPWALGTSTSSTGFAAIWYQQHAAATSTDSILGNKIMNFSSATTNTANAWDGIYINAGSVAIGDGTDANQNVIGNASSTFGISVGSTFANNVVGIYINTSSSSTAVINDNVIANIAYTGTSVVQDVLYGIFYNSSASPSVKNCQIYALTISDHYATRNAIPELAGIYTNNVAAASGPIMNNVIHNLTSTGGVAAARPVVGIYLNSASATPPTGTIANNYIHGLSLATTSTDTLAYTAGIVNNGSSYIYNNMIQLGLKPSDGSSVTTGYMYGIYAGNSSVGQANFYYNNSVYIGGTSVTAGNTFCFRRIGAPLNGTGDILQNNIFYNNRQGSGSHFAIALTSNTKLVSDDYNILLTSNSSSVVGAIAGIATSPTALTYSSWLSSTGSTTNCFNNDPQFKTPGGTDVTCDLHINSAASSSAPGNGLKITTPAITTDYDGETRATGTKPSGPSIGADEMTNGVSDMIISDISNTALAAGNIQQGSTSVVGQLQLTGANSTATLNTLNFTSAGTYVAADISNFKLWYNTSNTFSGASQIGSSITTSLGGGSHSFTSLTQSIAASSSNYIFITVDVAGSGTSTIGDNINVASIVPSNLTFSATVNRSGSATQSGLQTIVAPVPPNVTVANISSALPAGPINTNATGIIYRFQTTVSLSTATLNTVNFTTSGTYSVSDVSNFKLWYNSTTDSTTASQIGSSITTSLGGGSHTFSSLTQAVISGAVGYFWITADVASGGTAGHTIIVSAFSSPSSNLTYASINTLSGTTSAGGTRTINSSCTAVSIASQPATPGAVCSGNGTANIAVSVSGSANYTYTWQTSANGTTGWSDLTNTSPYGSTAVTTGTSATTNSLTITNPSTALNAQYFRCNVTNCTSSSAASNAVQLTVNASPATPTVNVSNNCGNSVLSTTATGSLSWSSGQTTSAITVTNAATYTVTAAASGCSSSGTGTSAPLAIPATPTVTVGVTCPTTATLSTTATGSLSWSPGGATTSSMVASVTGTYSVTTTNGSGCTSAPGTGTVTTIPAGLNSNTHGPYTIGGSSPDYASFAAALAGAASCGITGPVIFNVRNGTYTETLTISAIGGATSTNTITFQPESGATVTLTSSTSGQSNATATFDGAAYIIFEGRQNGSGTANSFIITNTTTSAAAIQFIDDANHDNIQYCAVQGSFNTGTSNGGGLIEFGTSTGSTGNDNITIDHNKIGNSSALVSCCVYSFGTAGKTNSDNTISNNEIFNFGAQSTFFNYGIRIMSTGNGSNWTITGNSIYHSSATSPSAAIYGIDFEPGSAAISSIIKGNYIGGQSANCGGSAYSVGTNFAHFITIVAGTDNSNPTVIDSNTIQNINSNGGFYCIEVTGGTTTITNNVIGHPTTANSITTTSGGSASIGLIYINCNNNTLVDSNLISNISGTSGSNSLWAITYFGSGGVGTIKKNTIQNCTGNGTNSGEIVRGIYVNQTSATGQVISGNTITNFGNNFNSSSIIDDGVFGIYVNGTSSGGTISQNRITKIYDRLPGTVYGIYLTSSGSFDVVNNFIHTTNNGFTNATYVHGIYNDASGTINTYYNTVFISGAVTGNASCYLRDAAGTAVVKNNIFINAHTSSTGSHYAVWNATSSGSYTSDYNFLASAFTAKLGNWQGTAVTFSGWQGHSVDAHSTNAQTTSSSSSSTLINPSELFVDATNGDLHIAGNIGYGFVSNNGTVLSLTTDIDGDSRTSTPDMGADEFTPCTPPSTPTVSVTNACGSTVLSTTATGTLSWSNGATTTAITVTNAATYSVTQTVSACTSAAGTGTSAPYSSPSASASQVNVLCNGGSTGTATSTTTGGSTPYTYIWSTTATTSSITGLAAATYTLTVTDVHTCSSTTTVTITQPSALSASAGQTNPSCNGGSNGTATSTTSGGTAPYTYAWSTGSTLSSITALSANTYTLTVTDTHSCTSTTTVTLTNPAAIPTPSVTVTSACGSSVLSTTATGTLSWSPGGSTASSISVTGTATYSVTQTIGGCTSPPGTGTAAPYSTPTASASHTDASCNGFSDGIATSTTTGGTTPYAYLWSPGGSTNSSISGLSSSTYTLTVTDAHGCTSIGTVGVGQPGPVSTPSVTVANGCGSSVLSTTSTGTLSWSNGASSSAITVTNAATYSVTTTNGSGCTSAAGTGTSAPNSGPTASASHTDVSCHGGTNGTATSTTGGGTTPYSYAWSSGETTSSISSKAAGTYTLTVSDAHSCSSTTTVTISEPSALSASAGHTDVTCAGGDGTATSTTSGGTTPYTYAWSSGETTSSISGKAAGTYTLTVTDTHSCTSSTTATIGASSGCGLTYTVKVFLQGYYIGSGDMSPLLKLLNASSSPTAVDTVTIELHASGTTANYTYTGILQSNGNIVCSFTSAAAGSYYVVVKHRNSLTTYSASAQTISDGGSYDFTTGAGQAYGSGNRMANVGGSYAIYGGDINGDGSINISDKTSLQTALSSFTIGSYDVHDITGDGFVDEDDLRILQNNIPLSLTVQHP